MALFYNWEASQEQEDAAFRRGTGERRGNSRVEGFAPSRRSMRAHESYGGSDDEVHIRKRQRDEAERERSQPCSKKRKARGLLFAYFFALLSCSVI
jgi:hypothetical protein